jgi:CubicO group peptidase (beta-lactamase class C family)
MVSHSSRCAFAVVLAMSGAACQRARVAAVSEPAPPQSIDELRARLQALVDEAKLPGVGFAVVEPGDVVYAGGVGYADLGRRVAVTGETRFRVGSVTKSLVALALLTLCDQGKLWLDAALADVAPEIAAPNRWAATHPVRVAHLLEHTAGFDDMGTSDSVQPPGPELPLRAVLAVRPASQVPRWPPGTRMSYSNPGYSAAAYLIEKLTGRAHEDYIRDALLAPMGMAHATMRLTPEVEVTLARGYDQSRHEVPPVALLHRAAGSLVAAPSDLAQLVRFFLQRGRAGGIQVVAQASVRRAERSATLADDGRPALATQYGLGNYGSNLVGLIFRGHDGGIDGFSAEYGYAPDVGAGWAVLFNSRPRSSDYDRIVRLVAGFATRTVSRPPARQVEVPSPSLAKLTGYYRLASPRNERTRFIDALAAGIVVTLDGGVLQQRPVIGARVPLVPLSATLFRRSDEAGASVLFTHAEDGTPLMIAGTSSFERASPWPVVLAHLPLALALLLVAGSLVIVLVRRPGRAWPLLAAPTAATLLLASSLLARALRPTMIDLATPSAISVALFAWSVAYPLVAAISLGVAIRAVRDPATRHARRYALMVAVAHLTICAYLFAWGLVAYRTWAG